MFPEMIKVAASFLRDKIEHHHHRITRRVRTQQQNLTSRLPYLRVVLRGINARRWLLLVLPDSSISDQLQASATSYLCR